MIKRILYTFFSQKFNFSLVRILACASVSSCPYLVHVEQRKELLDLLRADEELWRGVPVSSGHLILELVDSDRSGCDSDAARLMEAHGLRHKHTSTLQHTQPERMNLSTLVNETDAPHLSRLGLQLLEEFDAVIMNLLQINARMIICGESRLWMMTSSDICTLASRGCAH